MFTDLVKNLRVRNFFFPGDYQSVQQLWQNAGSGIHLRRSDEPEEIQKKIQRDPDLFLVAELNGEILGTVLGGFDGRRGMVYHLAVKQSYRRQGVATLLMNELEKRLRNKGCVRYYLLVTRENIDAKKFYENIGWEKMDLHIYGKDIN